MNTAEQIAKIRHELADALAGFGVEWTGPLDAAIDKVLRDNFADIEHAYTEERVVGSLMVTREWADVFAVLATSVSESLELVKEIKLKQKSGHPFYWGQMSLLRTLKEMVEDDQRRFAAGSARATALSALLKHAKNSYSVWPEPAGDHIAHTIEYVYKMRELWDAYQQATSLLEEE